MVKKIHFKLPRVIIVPKIKIDDKLFDPLKDCSVVVGYSSVDEFIAHGLGKEVELIEDAEDDPDVKERLKGLGYSGEDAIPKDSQLQTIRVSYLPAEYPFFIWNLSAIAYDILLSGTLGFCVKPFIKVNI